MIEYTERLKSAFKEKKETYETLRLKKFQKYVMKKVLKQSMT